MKLKGRTALVTGGSRGIGRAIALALAEEGADVAVNYVSSEGPARAVVESIGKLGRRSVLAQADVGDYPDTYRMAQDVLKEFGHLDILVNNAGINSDKTFVKMDHASWRKVLSINLDGVFNCTKVFLDQMLRQNYGRVVNITSAAVKGPIAELGLSNGARTGLTGFIAGLSRTTVRHNVTVNNLLPGPFETDRLRSNLEFNARKTGRSVAELRKLRTDANPAGRFGTIEEFGDACAYLCSAQAGFITGQNLLMDGGLYPGTF